MRGGPMGDHRITLRGGVNRSRGPAGLAPGVALGAL